MLSAISFYVNEEFVILQFPYLDQIFGIYEITFILLKDLSKVQD